MNASEAKALSASNAKRIAAEKAERANKEKKIQQQKEEEKRNEFREAFRKDAERAISYAIEYGESFARVCLSSDSDSFRAAEKKINEHPFKNELDKEMLLLTKQGYDVTTEVTTSEHTTQHESTVPDYTYYRYHAYVKISWA